MLNDYSALLKLRENWEGKKCQLDIECMNDYVQRDFLKLFSTFVNDFKHHNLDISRILRNKVLSSVSLKCLQVFFQNSVCASWPGIFHFFLPRYSELSLWLNTHVYCFCYLNVQAKPFKRK